MMVEPLGGWRYVNVTSRRMKVDFAMQVRQLVDVHYADTEKITLVMDNLNTHRMSSLYEAFTPEEARRLIGKVEVVHTPNGRFKRIDWQFQTSDARIKLRRLYPKIEMR